MEAFLTLCDDPESDIRMVADECLNRTIKVRTPFDAANFHIVYLLENNFMIF